MGHDLVGYNTHELVYDKVVVVSDTVAAGRQSCLLFCAIFSMINYNWSTSFVKLGQCYVAQARTDLTYFHRSLSMI